MAKVYKNDKFMISANVEVNNGDYSFISLQNFINDILAWNDYPELVKSNNSLYGLSGVRTAYGINKFIGLELMADLGYGETIQRGKDNKWFYLLGLNIDMNFSEFIKTPIGLSLGYLHSSYQQGSIENSYNDNIFLTQLSYIGRTNIVLSIDFQFSRELSSYNGQEFWMKAASFSMRYLF